MISFYLFCLIVFLSTGLICTRAYDLELLCPSVFKDQELVNITCLVNLTAFPQSDTLEFSMNVGVSEFQLCSVTLPTSCSSLKCDCGCVDSSKRGPHTFVYQYKPIRAFHENGHFSCAVLGFPSGFDGNKNESCKRLNFGPPITTPASKDGLPTSASTISDFLFGRRGKKWILAMLLSFIQLLII